MKFSKWGGGGGGGQKIKVAQNGGEHGLVLEFLRSNEIFKIWSEKLTGQQASIGSIHPDTIVTRKVARSTILRD